MDYILAAKGWGGGIQWPQVRYTLRFYALCRMLCNIFFVVANVAIDAASSVVYVVDINYILYTPQRISISPAQG
jgi:hypothetical protein